MTGIEPLFLQFGPQAIVNILVSGLGQAGLYIILAAGLTLIFGLMGVLNFAHGALMTIGTYLAVWGLFKFGVPAGGGYDAFLPLLLLMALAFLFVGAFGGAIEFTLVRRLYDRPAIDQILLTFGIATVLLQVTEILVDVFDPGTEPRAATPWNEPSKRGPEILRGSVDFLGIDTTGLILMEIVLGAVVAISVWLFLTRTRYGLYIRAGSEDDEMAEALGINVKRVFTVVFGIGSGLAGIAGMFLIWEPTYTVQIGLLGSKALLPAFIVVVIGGLGTFKGTVIASVIAGIFYEFGVYVSTNVIEFVSLPNMLLFILLVVMLIVRPTGILGEEEVGGH